MTKPTGYFKMWRGWAKNPALKNNNDYRYLWLYLIESCAFVDTTVDRFGFPIEVKRGELIISLRRLASEVNITERSLRTALKTFENHEMIVLKTDTGTTQITLCNYDVFQDDLKKPTQERHRSDTQNKEVKEIKKKEREKWWEDGYKC